MTELTFAEALKLARRWWWIAVLLPLLAAATAYLVTSTLQPMYEAQTSLLIDATQADTGSNYNSLLAAERLSRTYSELATTDAVLEETVSRLDRTFTADELDEMVTVSAIEDTQLLQVVVTDSDPERAATIANTLATVFTEQVQEQRASTGDPVASTIGDDIALVRDQIDDTSERIRMLEARADAASQVVQSEIQPLRTLLNTYQTTYAELLEIQQRLALASAESMVNVLVVNPASASDDQVSPRTTLNTVLGGVLGVMLAAGVIAIMGYRDNTVKSTEDVQQVTGRAAIGMIPQLQSSDKIEAIVNPRSPATESYRGLRTNLQFASIGKDLKSLVITSSGPGEGKSTTAMNLGVVLAQSGQRVILVDADLRRPTLHKLGGLNNRAGLTNMLIADAGSEASFYCQKTDIPSLLVVPTGPLPPNPSDVLNSPRMGEIIKGLAARADIVLIDTPPMVFSDAQIVAGLVDGCLVVTQAGRTRSTDLRDVVQTLEQTGANIVGIVVNRINFGRAEYRRREYYTTYYNADPETANLGGSSMTPPPRKRWFSLSR